MEASIPRAVLEPTGRLGRQFLRYGVVGLIAFLADFAALVVLTELCGVHYALAAAWGFLIGLVINYRLSVAWVFRDCERTVGSRTSEFLIFAAVGAAGLLLTEAILWLGTERLAVDYRVSKVAAVAVVFIWNFALRKLLLFRSHEVAAAERESR